MKCIKCSKKYDRLPSHEKSKDIKVYCKHLGCCSKECYDKLPEKHKDNLFLSTWVNALIN